VRLIDMLIRAGLVTREEIAAGKPDPATAKLTPPLTAEIVPEIVARRGNYTRGVPAIARFKPGDRVNTRNINPVGHTRLPRYARGKSGEIVRDHGVFVFPDSNAHFQGENPQHLYSVRFASRELWGEDASPRDSVYVDLWESYLERA
jgi:nitrile hydratase subunit beta